MSVSEVTMTIEHFKSCMDGCRRKALSDAAQIADAYADLQDKPVLASVIAKAIRTLIKATP